MYKSINTYFRKLVVIPSALMTLLLSGCLAQPNNMPVSYQPSAPLHLPGQSINEVLNWANEAATSVYTYDYVNYQQDLQHASQYFTPAGWKAYLASLNLSGNLQMVIDKKLIVSARTIGAPVIVEQGAIGEKYTWKIQLPLTVTYQSSQNLFSQNVVVTMLITRLPANATSGVRGLGLDQFIAVSVDSDNKSSSPHVLISHPAVLKGNFYPANQ